MTVGTAQDFIANLEAKLGKGYSETIDGGVGPDYYDCSGLVMVCAAEAGVTIERTTWDQWDTLTRVEGEGLVGIEPGNPVYFSVPSDGGDPPQHVGVYLGPNLMIEAPHPGEVVMYSPIPNTPSEYPIGYCRIPFAAPAPPPPPPPPAPSIKEPSMFAADPVTGGIWATDANGDCYPAGGAPLIPGLNTHPGYDAGSAESGGTNPCVGIEYWRFDELDGVYYITAPTNGEGGWDGSVNPASKACPYNLYRFLRSGQPA